MELTRTEQMLLQAIKAALCGQKTGWKDASPQELDELMRLALQHKLQPIVFDAVYSCPAAARWDALAAQRSYAKTQVLAQAAKDAEFITLWKEFCDAGCTPLVVKGILCRELYPNGDLRQSGDEDLFAAPPYYLDCCRVLRENGFAPMGQADEQTADEIGWYKQGSPLRIELHRNLFSQKTDAVKDLQSFFSDTFTTQKAYLLPNGIAVCSMTEHDHLLYLLLHAYKHFIRGGFGIRQVCDIGLWCKAYYDQIDWTQLYVQCQSVNALKFSAAVLQIAQQELQIEFLLPECWMQIGVDCVPLLRDILTAGVYGNTDPNRAHSAAVTQNAVSAKRSKRSGSTLRAVFPPKKALLQDYPILQKHGFLLPAVWCRRLLRYRQEVRQNDRESAGTALRIAKERKKLLKYYDIF